MYKFRENKGLVNKTEGWNYFKNPTYEENSNSIDCLKLRPKLDLVSIIDPSVLSHDSFCFLANLLSMNSSFPSLSSALTVQE